MRGRVISKTSCFRIQYIFDIRQEPLIYCHIWSFVAWIDSNQCWEAKSKVMREIAESVWYKYLQSFFSRCNGPHFVHQSPNPTSNHKSSGIFFCSYISKGDYERYDWGLIGWYLASRYKLSCLTSPLGEGLRRSKLALFIFNGSMNWLIDWLINWLVD